MRTLTTITALLLVFTAGSYAEPITTGEWSKVSVIPNVGIPFFNGVSWDCEQCGITWQLNGVDYLHDRDDPSKAGHFTWAGPVTVTDLGGTSQYLPNHRFTHTPGGEFQLDNGHGWTASSANGGALLVRLVAPQWIDYWLWFEDLPPWSQDRDYQDRGFTWRVHNASTAAELTPTPEPGTWVLMATGVAYIFRRARQGRGQHLARPSGT